MENRETSDEVTVSAADVTVRAWQGAFLVLGLYLAVIVPIVVAQGGDAVWFVKFGRSEPALSEYASKLLDEPNLVVPFFEPHDGPRFWALARDPLLLNPEEIALGLDFPGYRARRIFYPALASPFHLGGEHALLWGMLFVNLAVVFVGTHLTIRLAADMGAPSRAAIGFAANPCVIAGVMLDISDTLMVAALVGLVYAVRRNRDGWALAAAVIAVLTKEVAVVGVLGVAVGAVGRPVTRRVRLAAVPILCLVAWSLYAGLRFDWQGMVDDVFRLTPFSGWVFAYRFGWSPQSKWDEFAVAIVVLLLALVVLVRWLERRSVGLWCALGFALLLPFVSHKVVFNPMNSTRALGPAFTFLVLDLYAGSRDVQRWPDLRSGLTMIRRRINRAASRESAIR